MEPMVCGVKVRLFGVWETVHAKVSLEELGKRKL
jgi:hypothetical protein